LIRRTTFGIATFCDNPPCPPWQCAYCHLQVGALHPPPLKLLSSRQSLTKTCLSAPNFCFSNSPILSSYYHNASFLSQRFSSSSLSFQLTKYTCPRFFTKGGGHVFKYLLHFQLWLIYNQCGGFGWCNFARIAFTNPTRLQLTNAENQMVSSHVMWLLQSVNKITNLLKYLEWYFKPPQQRARHAMALTSLCPTQVRPSCQLETLPLSWT
jgi:hypothetical protein